MNKIYFLVITFLLLSSTFSQAKAVNIDVELNNSIIIQSKIKTEATELSRADMFSYFGDYFGSDIKSSYKYIKLNFKGILENTKLYSDLQKLVYLDILENKDIFIHANKKIKAYELYKFAEKFSTQTIIKESEISELKSRNASKLDFKIIKDRLKQLSYKIPEIEHSSAKAVLQKKDIFSDVYETIKESHYNKTDLSDEKLIDGAISGLANATNDKYTTYFPAAESKAFNEVLSGEYEGIGAYVEMEKPGEVTIVSPISGSPSEKAGLKGGDIITKVDSKQIEKDTSLQEAVSWIKGKAGTSVKLDVKRGEQKLQIDVIRGNIVIKDLEYKKLDNSTFYIDIRFFGDHIASDFNTSLEVLKQEKSIQKIIIDLRNNPGGYLDQVTDMLSHIVPAGESTAVVKYQNGNKQNYSSAGYNIIDFSKYKIVILQNGGSASASEIMIATIKDYFPKTILVGEKTYGKGSVQTIKDYIDGSSFKYTIARWFSGKTETGIDGIGIKPDYEIVVDKYIKDESSDPQLNKAKSIY